MSETQEQEKQLTATQRIENLEKALMSLYSTADNMARDVITIKDAIKLLGNKVDSIVKASERGEAVNDEVLTKIMVENNVEELKEKVSSLVRQGVLVAQDQVEDNSFVVGRELTEAGEVANPRLQFPLASLKEELRDKIKGSKSGDVLVLQEGKLRFEVVESYAISAPRQDSSPSDSAGADATNG